MSAVSDHKKQYPRETYDEEEMRSFERTENFQGLKSNFGQLLQVLLYEAPGSWNNGCYEGPLTLRPLGNLPPLPPIHSLLWANL